MICEDMASWYKLSLVSVNNEGVNMMLEGRFGHAIDAFHSAERMFQSCHKENPLVSKEEEQHHSHDPTNVTTSCFNHHASSFNPFVYCVTMTMDKHHQEEALPGVPASSSSSSSINHTPPHHQETPCPTTTANDNSVSRIPSWWSDPQRLEDQFYLDEQDEEGNRDNLAVQILHLPMLVVDENHDSHQTKQQDEIVLRPARSTWPMTTTTSDPCHRSCPCHHDDSSFCGPHDHDYRSHESQHHQQEQPSATSTATTRTRLDFVLFYNLALSCHLAASHPDNIISPMINNHAPSSFVSSPGSGGGTNTTIKKQLFLQNALEYYSQAYTVLATQQQQHEQQQEEGDATLIPLIMVILNNVGQIYLELDNEQEATHCFHWLLCIMSILHQSGNSSQMEHWDIFRVNVWCGILLAWHLRFKSHKPAPAA